MYRHFPGIIIQSLKKMIVEALLGCVLLFLLYKNFSKPASLPPGKIFNREN